MCEGLVDGDVTRDELPRETLWMMDQRKSSIYRLFFVFRFAIAYLSKTFCLVLTLIRTNSDTVIIMGITNFFSLEAHMAFKRSRPEKGGSE